MKGGHRSSRKEKQITEETKKKSGIIVSTGQRRGVRGGKKGNRIRGKSIKRVSRKTTTEDYEDIEKNQEEGKTVQSYPDGKSRKEKGRGRPLWGRGSRGALCLRSA